MKCKYEGSGVWEGRCVGTKEVDPCPGYDKCKRYKPNCKTNADHIRAMTDEELRQLLCSLTECGSCSWGRMEGCVLADWLKQPYEEDTNG